MKLHHAVTIGALVIIVVGIWRIYANEEKRLDSTLEQQKTELLAMQAAFNDTVAKIQSDAEEGLITQEEASDLLLEAYRKSLTDNQILLESTLLEILDLDNCSAISDCLEDD